MSTFEPLPEPVLHSIVASDGWLLRVFDFSPPLERGAQVRGVAIVGHAMMADSRTVCRPDQPTLAAVLVAAGFRVLVPDLRGHGDSGPRAAEGGDWTIDELIADVAHYVELARTLEPRRPISLVGHSLFAHLALAWLGQNPDPSVRALVLMSCSVWNQRFEPRRVIWWIKRALFELMALIVTLVGYLPARRLHLGSADEAPGFWRQFLGHVRRDCWDSLDGSVDYWAGLDSVRAPVLHVMSEGDHLFARPPAAARLTARINHCEMLVLGRDDAPGELALLRPNHMQLLTSPRSKLAWHWLAGWLTRKLG